MSAKSTILVSLLSLLLTAGCDPPLPVAGVPADGGGRKVAGAPDAGCAGDPGATKLSEPRCDPRPGGLGEWQAVAAGDGEVRLGATATVLDDGDILLVGGWPATGVDQCGGPPRYGTADIVERFSVATGEWHLVATPLEIGRWYHTTTKLEDGRVLVAGGLWPEHEGYPYFCPADIPAEIYDPDADTWTPTSPMHYQRAGAVAVLLADGRVLVIGGTGSGSTEIYDPNFDTWTEAAPTQLDIERAYPGGALLLGDGTVMAFGEGIYGTGSSATWTLETEIYDPYVDTWRDQRPLLVGSLGEVYGIIMQPLPGGRVMVALVAKCLADCYTTNAEVQETAFIEDPYSGSWSMTPPLPSITSFPASAALSDGRILVAGGRVDAGGGSTLAASIYDEKSETWRRAADMPTPRESPLLVPFGPASAVVIGGVRVCFPDPDLIDSYNLPVVRYWLRGTSAPGP